VCASRRGALHGVALRVDGLLPTTLKNVRRGSAGAVNRSPSPPSVPVRATPSAGATGALRSRPLGGGGVRVRRALRYASRRRADRGARKPVDELSLDSRPPQTYRALAPSPRKRQARGRHSGSIGFSCSPPTMATLAAGLPSTAGRDRNGCGSGLAAGDVEVQSEATARLAPSGNRLMGAYMRAINRYTRGVAVHDVGPFS
jgi:hypothetical protein